ncbi:hypothetical protein FD724_10030 [Nostoc sp. C057]|uniref:hypothetical protein n=1 Tax=Nostoc sp. C057 TaxID=2576903 RepID=UPI0015C37244|nr:hypothetical protein [Nostoc sp. C057]QLE48419.1 hypothetical protein FD724_10030 [Nostoc sp. C057]
MAQSQIPLTEFGEAIREIYKNPDLPTEVLPESKITPKENEALREKWTKIIFKKNNVGAKKGLSLDDFIELIKEFFGFPAINRSLLDRLIHTGNPARDHYAKEVREDSLKIVSLFTKKYSFDDLLSIGNKVLKERENEFRTYPVGQGERTGFLKPLLGKDLDEKIG